MAKNAVIRARTDATLKQKVDEIFENIGINTSQALNMFYHQIVLHRGLPFNVSIPNSVTRRAIDESRSGKTKSFKTTENLFNDLEI